LYEPIPQYGSYSGQIIIKLEGEQEQIIILMGLLGSLCLLAVAFWEAWFNSGFRVMCNRGSREIPLQVSLQSAYEKNLARAKIAEILRSNIEIVVDWVVSGARGANRRFPPTARYITTRG
jgi:hypothetical protein